MRWDSGDKSVKRCGFALASTAGLSTATGKTYPSFGVCCG